MFDCPSPEGDLDGNSGSSGNRGRYDTVPRHPVPTTTTTTTAHVPPVADAAVTPQLPPAISVSGATQAAAQEAVIFTPTTAAAVSTEGRHHSSDVSPLCLDCRRSRSERSLAEGGNGACHPHHSNGSLLTSADDDDGSCSDDEEEEDIACDTPMRMSMHSESPKKLQRADTVPTPVLLLTVPCSPTFPGEPTTPHRRADIAAVTADDAKFGTEAAKDRATAANSSSHDFPSVLVSKLSPQVLVYAVSFLAPAEALPLFAVSKQLRRFLSSPSADRALWLPFVKAMWRGKQGGFGTAVENIAAVEGFAALPSLSALASLPSNSSTSSSLLMERKHTQEVSVGATVPPKTQSALAKQLAVNVTLFKEELLEASICSSSDVSTKSHDRVPEIDSPRSLSAVEERRKLSELLSHTNITESAARSLSWRRCFFASMHEARRDNLSEEELFATEWSVAFRRQRSRSGGSAGAGRHGSQSASEAPRAPTPQQQDTAPSQQAQQGQQGQNDADIQDDAIPTVASFGRVGMVSVVTTGAPFPPLPCQLFDQGRRVQIQALPAHRVSRLPDWGWRICNFFVTFTSVDEAEASEDVVSAIVKKKEERVTSMKKSMSTAKLISDDVRREAELHDHVGAEESEEELLLRWERRIAGQRDNVLV